MVSTVRRQETREEAILRLAQRARESGVKLVRNARDGRHFVSSASQPGQWHYVTALSCDCRGFATHGRCMHHSALLVALGWVTEDPTPEPGPATCASCNGQGHTTGTELYRGSRVDIMVSCHRCHGTGQEPLAA
jgi:hypothetical protein